MKRFVRTSAMLVLAAIVLSGCFKEKRDFTLNADGSGKVVYEAWLPLMKIGGTGGAADAEKNARKEAARILSASEGVATWKDVSWEVDKDGMLHFKGTAYFSDLNKVNIHGSARGNAQPAWRAEKGTAVLELGEANAVEKTTPAQLTAAEIEQRATSDRNKFKQQLPMFGAVLTEYRGEWTFALPGAPAKTVNFEKPAAANTVRVVYDGPKVLEALTKLTTDDAFWKAQAVTGRDFEKNGPDPELLNEKLFGTRGPIQAVLRAPLKDQFNYAAEVAAAKAGFDAMMVGLKLEAAAAPAAQGGGFKQLRVAGICLVTESDNEKGIRPFSREKGFAVSLVGELPGAVLAIKDGVVKTAIADTGEDLLPEREFDRDVDWPRLSEDRTTVTFDVETRLPGPNVKGFKEISGTLVYQVATGTKDVDLGALALKAGTKGKALEAEIKTAGKSEWQEGTFEVTLSLQTGVNAIKEVRFLDDKGAPIEVQRQGTTSFGDEKCEMTFTRKGEFPAQAKIVVQMHDNLKDFTIPFKLENMDLLGRTAR